MEKFRVKTEGLEFTMLIPKSRVGFEKMVRSSYGRCPVSGLGFNIEMSRICPMMAGVAKLLGIEVFAAPALCRCPYKEAGAKVEDNALRLVVL